MRFVAVSTPQQKLCHFGCYSLVLILSVTAGRLSMTDCPVTAIAIVMAQQMSLSVASQPLPFSSLSLFTSPLLTRWHHCCCSCLQPLPPSLLLLILLLHRVPMLLLFTAAAACSGINLPAGCPASRIASPQRLAASASVQLKFFSWPVTTVLSECMNDGWQIEGKIGAPAVRSSHHASCPKCWGAD